MSVMTQSFRHSASTVAAGFLLKVSPPPSKGGAWRKEPANGHVLKNGNGHHHGPLKIIAETRADTPKPPAAREEHSSTLKQPLNLSWMDRVSLSAIRKKLAKVKRTEARITAQIAPELRRLGIISGALRWGFGDGPRLNPSVKKEIAALQEEQRTLQETVERPQSILSHTVALRKAMEEKLKTRLEGMAQVKGPASWRKAKEETMRSKVAIESKTRSKRDWRNALLDPTRRDAVLGYSETPVYRDAAPVFSESRTRHMLAAVGSSLEREENYGVRASRAMVPDRDEARMVAEYKQRRAAGLLAQPRA